MTTRYEHTPKGSDASECVRSSGLDLIEVISGAFHCDVGKSVLKINVLFVPSQDSIRHCF